MTSSTDMMQRATTRLTAGARARLLFNAIIRCRVPSDTRGKTPAFYAAKRETSSMRSCLCLYSDRRRNEICTESPFVHTKDATLLFQLHAKLTIASIVTKTVFWFVRELYGLSYSIGVTGFGLSPAGRHHASVCE